jgi:hypothetical protein
VFVGVGVHTGVFVGVAVTQLTQVGGGVGVGVAVSTCPGGGVGCSSGGARGSLPSSTFGFPHGGFMTQVLPPVACKVSTYCPTGTKFRDWTKLVPFQAT